MAHVKKYTQGALHNMLAHYDRTAKNSRENIDPSLTHLNYNLAEKWQPLPQKEFIDKRLSQVRVQKRKDVNVMCSWVLTAPKSLDPREYKRFFKAGYRFMERRYGRDNVISAYVHMDEPSAMPHMHFAFVPVLHDLEKGIDRLCAKKVVSRQDLKSFHNDLEAEISRSLGHGVEILNEATKEGNKSIMELKRLSHKELMDKMLEQDLAITSLLDENKQLKRQVKDLEQELAGEEQEFDFFREAGFDR